MENENICFEFFIVEIESIYLHFLLILGFHHPIRSNLRQAKVSMACEPHTILHWDISSRNVLHYSEPIWRPSNGSLFNVFVRLKKLLILFSRFERTINVNQQWALPIDGDHVTKWCE
jgi:hypothetical protein